MAPRTLAPSSCSRIAVSTCTSLLIFYPSSLLTAHSHSDGTINYQARQHQINFVLTPYYSAANLSFGDALKTLQLSYQDTLLYTERNNTKTSGLDALAVRPPQDGFPDDPEADPAMPIPSETFNHLSLDLEGLVLTSDGS